MTSTLVPHKHQKKSAISAQDLLNLSETVIKNGMLRKKGRKLNVGKWPHRLVVLTHDSVYVFNNESAKAQNSKFCLYGYNQVTRSEFKNQQWCFSIVPALNDESVAAKTFACVSDAERKLWMKAIKNQMYVANCIPKPDQISDKFQSMASITGVDDYSSLEMLVFSPTEGMQTRQDSLFCDEDEDDDDDENSSSGSQRSALGSIKLLPNKQLPNKPLPNKQLPNKPDSVGKSRRDSTDSDLHAYETLDENLIASYSAKTKPEVAKNQSSTPLRSSSQTPDVTQSNPANSSKPPRYSEVMCSVDAFSDNCEYVNANIFRPMNDTATHQSLESMCTITDPRLDRDQLIRMLEATETGTYLIRKSRHGDQKVISYLNQNGQVKEYKIHGTIDRPSLNQNRFFSSIEDLLRYYTLVEPLPNSTGNLKTGFHQQTTK